MTYRDILGSLAKNGGKQATADFISALNVEDAENFGAFINMKNNQKYGAIHIAIIHRSFSTCREVKLMSILLNIFS